MVHTYNPNIKRRLNQEDSSLRAAWAIEASLGYTARFCLSLSPSQKKKKQSDIKYTVIGRKGVNLQNSLSSHLN